MKFKRPLLIRNIENPKDYEIDFVELGLKEYMSQDADDFIGFCFSILMIWFALCLMFSSVLVFTYLIKTYF